MHITINKNYLTFNNFKVKCAIGKKGIGYKNKEGDLKTPVGHYKIKYLLYRKDRIKKIKTKLRKIIITKKMGWCNDPTSKSYNQLIKLPFNYTYEKLFRKENAYDLILVLNFNMNPIIKNKGSAIFIHVAKKKFNKTEGCVAIKKPSLIKLIKKINLNTEVKISPQI